MPNVIITLDLRLDMMFSISMKETKRNAVEIVLRIQSLARKPVYLPFGRQAL